MKVNKSNGSSTPWGNAQSGGRNTANNSGGPRKFSPTPGGLSSRQPTDALVRSLASASLSGSSSSNRRATGVPPIVRATDASSSTASEQSWDGMGTGNNTHSYNGTSQLSPFGKGLVDYVRQLPTYSTPRANSEGSRRTNSSWDYPSPPAAAGTNRTEPFQPARTNGHEAANNLDGRGPFADTGYRSSSARTYSDDLSSTVPSWYDDNVYELGWKGMSPAERREAFERRDAASRENARIRALFGMAPRLPRALR